MSCLIIEASTPLCLLQDAGRFGVRHLGVTQGGALDWVSMSWANWLLGNALDAPVVEITLGGFAARVCGEPGDVVEVAEKAKNQLRIKAALAAAESRGFPEWVEVNVKEAKGTYKARPERSELSSTINESLVIELYSK